MKLSTIKVFIFSHRKDLITSMNAENFQNSMLNAENFNVFGFRNGFLS